MRELEKIRLKDVNPMNDREMKVIYGGSTGSGSDGEVCWQYCYTYDGQRTISMWTTCKAAYHRCTERGEIAKCACNGG